VTARESRIRSASLSGQIGLPVITQYLTIENAAALLGLINVAILVRRSIWNYPFGIASVALYTYVFFTAGLYSDTLLQPYFLLMQIYGWWNWLHGRNNDGLARIESMSAQERILFGTGTALLAFVLGWTFSHFRSAAAPWMDATCAAMSITAQYLLSIRRLENWFLWIAVDVIYVALYWWKGLHATSFLYAVFLVLSIAGLIEWQREYRTHVSTPARTAAA